MLCDQKKPYEELPFLLNSKHLNVSSGNNTDSIVAPNFNTGYKHRGEKEVS